MTTAHIPAGHGQAYNATAGETPRCLCGKESATARGLSLHYAGVRRSVAAQAAAARPVAPSPRDLAARLAALRPAPVALDENSPFTLTWHVSHQVCPRKGFSEAQVLDAANNWQVRYPSNRVPGQYRHISGEVVAVVDPIKRQVVTAYENVRETDLRPDQTDDDARAYAAARG